MKIGEVYGVAELVRSTTCFACHQPIEGETVWLGERFNGVQEEWPFHPVCADQPWPLYETRRTDTRLQSPERLADTENQQ